MQPLSAEKYSLQLTIRRSTHDKLMHAKALLSHAMPSGDVAEVLDRALDVLIQQLERRKFAATDKPRATVLTSGAPNSCPDEARPVRRYVPAQVRRSVWQRDGGRCTFVSDAGHRCTARELLEYDHADPISQGGASTAPRMRLRCRAHNQFTAECEFGAEFMSRKREEARAARKARTPAVTAMAAVAADRNPGVSP